jgi:hypothetical protein
LRQDRRHAAAGAIHHRIIYSILTPSSTPFHSIQALTHA